MLRVDSFIPLQHVWGCVALELLKYLSLYYLDHGKKYTSEMDVAPWCYKCSDWVDWVKCRSLYGANKSLDRYVYCYELVGV